MKTVIEISDVKDEQVIETTLSFIPNIEGESEPDENTIATPSMLIGSYISYLITTGRLVELANIYYEELNKKRNTNAS